MVQPQHPRLEAVFSEAIGRGSRADREAYLQAACGGDEDLRRQVDVLLRSHDAAGDFLKPSAGPFGAEALPAADPPAEGPGARIGPYKLLQLIGEGGFGSVYLAEQEHPIRRKVALKVIKLGMDTRQVVARFEAERQALAMMDHPNIARVFDAGTTDSGRPYFVMELVNGVPVTEYCDVALLGTRDRLELFLPICHAVQHAHQKGVIHRDLKPNNVLVTLHDGVPVPKVIDFGIAKATAAHLTEKTLFTEYRHMVGTPEYMAPEQASGGTDVDTRSDVYSLGVLLYELLTGTTPFDARDLRGRAYGEIQRIIQEEEPPKPSTRLATLAAPQLAAVAARRGAEPRRLGTAVRGELDWIVMRCLAKDRGQRYGTALALAEDVRRHMDGEPVLARPPSGAYRLKKFVRRHRASVAAAAAVAAVLLLGIFGTTVGMLRARDAERRALSERNSARDAQRRSEQSEQQARREAARATAVGEFMRGIFALAQPETGASGGEAKVGELLTLAAGEIDSRLAGQPEEQVLARVTLADAFQRLEMDDEALEQLLEAHRVSRGLPGGEASEQTLRVGADLVTALYVEGRFNDALALARSTHEASRVLGEDHPVTWKAAHALALALGANGDVAASEQTWAALVRRVRHRPEARTPQHLGRYLPSLATCLINRGLDEEAREVMRELAEVLRANVATAEAAAAGGAPAAAGGRPRERAARSQPVDHLRLRQTYADLIRSNPGVLRLMMEAGLAEEAAPLVERFVNDSLAHNPEGTPTLTDRMTDLAHLKLLAGDKTAAARWYAGAIEMGRRLRPNSPDQDEQRWREWTLGCSSIADGWRSGVLRDHVWCALDDQLRDHVPARLAADEVQLDRLRFKLYRWTVGATGPGKAEQVAEGDVGRLKSLNDPPPGLYLLGLEVPRRANRPLRCAAWLPVLAWELEVYAIPRFESLRTRLRPWSLHGVTFSSSPAERRTAPALAMNDLLSFARGRGDRLHWFGVIARATVDLPAGTYRVSGSSDDGLRVFLDGKPVIDDWKPRYSFTNDAEVTVGPGRHEVRVEFFQQVGAYHLWLQIAPWSREAKLAAAALGGRVPELDSLIEILGNRALIFPDEAPQLLTTRAHLLGRAGRFDEATAAYLSLTRSDPDDFHHWYWAACLLAHAGDAAAYHDHVRAMTERHFDSVGTDPIRCERLVRAAALLPDGPVTDGQLADLLRRATAGNRPADQEPWCDLTSGLAHYRAGRFEPAVEALRKCQPAFTGDLAAAGATARYYQALALHRLGRPDDARRVFHEAEVICESELPIPRVDDLNAGRFENWVVCQTARREAAAVSGH